MNRASSLLPIIRFTPRKIRLLAIERHIARYEAQKIDAALANPASKEFQQFMRRAKTSDQAACWLALYKAKKQCLTTDRAARLARIEVNNDHRVIYKSGVKAPDNDHMSRSLNSDIEMPISEKPAMLVIESKLAKCFQTKPEPEDAEDIDNETIDEVIIDESESENSGKKKKKDEKKKPSKVWAMQLIHQDEKELAFEPAFFAEHRAAVIEHERRTAIMMDLRGSLKKHDQEILELRFERGLNIYEIAAHFGQTHKAIRAAFQRIAEILFKARERKEWADEHCNLQVLAADDEMPVVPVVLEKDGQLGWDLDGEVQQ